jgi:putative addiction module component (TIGR02574 family)
MAAIDKVFADARALPAADRAKLIGLLRLTLDDDGHELTAEEQQRVDDACTAELDRRIRAVEEGRMGTIPLDEAVAGWRARYPRR